MSCALSKVEDFIVRSELEASGQIDQLDQHLGEDGKWRKNKRKRHRDHLDRIAQATSAAVAGTVGQKAKRALIEAKLRENPGHSDRMIAKEVGCSQTTVGTSAGP